jgi:hypothetical protein
LAESLEKSRGRVEKTPDALSAYLNDTSAHGDDFSKFSFHARTKALLVSVRGVTPTAVTRAGPYGYRKLWAVTVCLD